MNIIFKKHWFKNFSIAIFFSLFLVFSVVQADQGDSCQSNADCNVNANEACINNICQFQSLAEGGSGLSIPTGNAQISSSIVQDRTFGELVITIVNYFIGILGLLATVVFVYAGVLMVLQGGNDEQVTKAKKMMLFAAIGIVVIILSFTAVRFITSSAGEDAGVDNGNGGICEVNGDCPAGQLCQGGLCSGTNECTFDSDCLSGNFCSEGQCVEGQGTEGGGVTGGETVPAFEEPLNNVDKTVSGLSDDMENLNDLINDLPQETQQQLDSILETGFMEDKIASISSLIQQTNDPTELAILENVLDILERLELLREEFDRLRDAMPESVETIESWDQASQHLDQSMADPKSQLKFRRFEQGYTKLKEQIRQFPVVLSRIQANPGEANAPMNVTFVGLGSNDPLGGTIAKYNWSFLDSNGNTVFLGTDPVVTYEFTKPNTYSVNLKVETSLKDGQGYKRAADGISTVRVRVNPPASRVAFLLNGVEPVDVYHVTLEEAKAGLAFDPSITTPALGRTIKEYEWSYGDGTPPELRTTAASVVHVYNEGGEYIVILKVTDDTGVVDKKQLKIFVKPLAADIFMEPAQGDVNTSFSFDASQSRSDEGDIRDYGWTIHDDQNNVVATSQQQRFNHRFERPGNYTITLLVTDVTGATDQHIRYVNIASRPPVANFSHTVGHSNNPNKINFSASGSYDPDPGDKITYSWDFNSDGTFEIVDTDQMNVSHTYIRPGEYKVTLLVRDSFGLVHQTDRIISIESILSGDIVVEKKAVQLGQEIIFKAQSPNAEAYFWEFGDGQIANTEEEEISYTYKQEGKYKVTLHFFDANDNSNTDVTYILVGKEESPVASATVLVNDQDPFIVEDLCGDGRDGIMISRSDNLLLSAENSLNRDGTSRLLSYAWNMSTGTQGSRKEFTHRFNEISSPGECSTTRLVVRDQVSGEVSEPDILYFKVLNQLPEVVDLVIRPQSTPQPDQLREYITPLQVNLRAVNPRDPDGNIVKYRWWYYPEGEEELRLGLHSTSEPFTDMIVTAQGLPGLSNKYYFVLEMTDNDGGTFNSLERFEELTSLEVVNGPNLSPVADFTLDKTTISVGDSITFTSLSYDPQGDILPTEAYSWDFDGDGAFDVVGGGPYINRQFNTPGQYEVMLKVTHRNLTSTATRIIEVQPVNSFPQAAFTYKVEGNSVTFDGSISQYDPDIPKNNLRYEWDSDIAVDANLNGLSDDDIDSVEVTPTFIYSEPGVYRVRLKVIDILGAEGVTVRDINLMLSTEQKEQNTYRSIQVSSPDRPLTFLNLTVSPVNLLQGNTADVIATIQNADHSPYTGKVFFEVLEGGGEFTPQPVMAKGSQATAVFTATELGPVRIRVTATGTFYGDLSEEVIINVN